jgi:ABC-type glycerol-3-phosphate transport system substrate-binding protein
MKLRGFGCGVVLSLVAISMLSCSPRRVDEITVLIRMMPAQERFFREQIVAAFEKQEKCKVNVATFNNEWDIERLLKLDAGKARPEIALVKTPFEMTRVLAKKGLMRPLTEVVDSLRVDQDMAEYHPLAAGLGYIDGRPYYIPRKLETRILFYRKSMVTDAIAKFPAHKTRINARLKTENGFGLPADYQLESDPTQWDYYDLYVVGSIWANEDYNGVKMGRIAHRGARYGGTALDIADRALQMGASKEDILRLDADRVAEVYLWERVFIRDSLYNPGMWNDPWKGSDMYNGIKDGKVFLAFFQQIDCFLVHGWPEDAAMPTYLPAAEDMGLAVSPKATSFELDKSGKAQFEGTRSISTGGWWWGIPKACPHGELAYKLARFITNKQNQAEEVSRFGMLPVRKDILTNLPQVFSEGWVGEIFATSVQQIKLNELTTVPLVEQYSLVGKNLVEAWYKLCVEYNEGKEGALSLAKMKAKLASDFVAQQKEILGADYPKQP